MSQLALKSTIDSISKNTLETVQRHAHRIAVTFVLASGLAGAIGILSLAKIVQISLPTWWPIRITPLADPSTHGAVVAAAVTWAGGSLAFATYLFTYHQKESHYKGQARRERDQAELQRIEAEFAALVSDFSSDGQLKRINAAIGLGEVAVRTDPRRLDDNGKLLPSPAKVTHWRDFELQHFESELPVEFRSLKSEANFPYFSRAVNRLVAALHQWPEEAARSQVLRVLEQLATWSSDNGQFETDEPLLHFLINRLAEANRDAWDMFIEESTASLGSGVPIEKVLHALGISADSPSGLTELGINRDALISHLKAKVAKAVRQRISRFPANERSQSSSFAALFVKGDSFLATQRALVFALRCMCTVPEYRSFPYKPFDLSLCRVFENGAFDMNLFEERLSSAEATWTVDLDELLNRRGLNLADVHLFGQDLSYIHFNGVECHGADFSGSDMKHCTFLSSLCNSIAFVGSNCNNAVFIDIELREASFEYSDCTEAIFATVDLSMSRLQYADCSLSVFWHNTMEDAKLGGAEFGQSGADGSAIVVGDDWKRADFSLGMFTDDGTWCELGTFDEVLPLYLAELSAEKG